jgi:predicted ArsR family transcriptional regulator
MASAAALVRQRALAHESRVAIMEVLRDGGRPLDVGGIAERVGLHVNTVRSHLALLLEAGLVQRHAEPRNEPGRPRQLYAAAAPDGRDGSEGYRLLARMLASYIASNVADAATAAEETGRQWGRHMTEAPAPFAQVSAEEAKVRLVELLDELGFAPRSGAEPGEIELRHCPFREVAEVHPEVACSLHLGLMRGAMRQLDAPLRVDELLPFISPDRCLTRVAVER